MQEKIESLCQKFFELMKIEVKSLKIECEDEGRSIYFIHLETDDSKIIIGTHGQTLENLKHLLSRMIETALGKSATVHLEVNDYLKSKDDKLFRYIDSRISFVVKSQKEITLPNLSSYERKKIHNYISEKNLTNVRSYSEGEGKNRMMHLAPVSKVLGADIDMDGIDI